jgi:hypothetical protein
MRAVIVSAQRSGGLFLAGCLSNHPDISCPREEIFKRESIWQKKLKMNHSKLLDFVLSQPYYEVNICRLTYDQIFNSEIQAFIKNENIKIIHLIRMILPTVTSTLLAKKEMREGTPRHFFDDTFQDNEILDSAPDEVIHRIKHLIGQRRGFKEHFGTDHLTLQYEEITKLGWMLPQDQAVKICEYLGVIPVRMTTRNKKMHRRPIRSYFQKWDQIEAEINRSFPEIMIID